MTILFKIRLLSIFTLFTSLTLFSQTYNWVGGTGDWNVSTNWSPIGIPGAGHTAIISGASNVNIPTGYTAESKEVQLSAGAKLTIQSGAELNNNGGTVNGIQLSDVNTELSNSGIIRCGNSGVVATAIWIANSANFINSAGAVIEVNNTTYDGLTIGASGSFTNYGLVQIGNLNTIGFNAVYLYNNGKFYNKSGATVEANRTSWQAITVFDAGTLFNNEGTMNIGNVAAINFTGIEVYSGGKFDNFSSGLIEINNTTLYDGIGLNNLNSEFVNSGTLKIGNISNIRRLGIVCRTGSKLTNQVSGQIEVNRISDEDGIMVNGTNSNFTNHGNIKIGNLGNINLRGAVCANAGTFLNAAGSNLEINRILNWDGITVYDNNSLFENSGNVTIGNLTQINNYAIVVINQGQLKNNATGLIEANNVKNYQGVLMYTNSLINNSGIFKIGNLSPINYTGIEMYSGAKFNNLMGANLEVNNTTLYDGIDLHDVNTEFTNSGIIKIGNLSNVKKSGIFVISSSKFINNSTGQIEINRIANEDGIVITDAGSTFTNHGNIQLGNAYSIQRHGIQIVNSGIVNNVAGGIINIDRCLDRGLWIGDANSKLENSGSISLGNNAASNFGQGLYMYGGSQVRNYSTGILEINRFVSQGILVSGASTVFTNDGTLNVGNNAIVGWEGIYVNGTGGFVNNTTGQISIDNMAYNGLVVLDASTFTNNGNFKIGNLGSIGWTGIYMANSATVLNSLTAAIEINNISAINGIEIRDASTKLTNFGSMRLGNLGPIKNNCFYIHTGGMCENKAGALLELNNTIAYSAMHLTGANSSCINSGSIKIGNISNLQYNGILLENTSTFQNTIGASIEISRIFTSDGLGISGNSVFTNEGTVKIGHLFQVQRDGIGIYSQGQFTNNATGVLEINKVIARHGINLENASTMFTNSGILKIGSTDPIGLQGIRMFSGSKFINNSGAHLEIDNTGQNAIQLLSLGTNFTNGGSILIGDKFLVGSSGISQSGTGSSFLNQTNGFMQINRSSTGLLLFTNTNFSNSGIIEIGNVVGIRGTGLSQSSSSIFTNQIGAILKINLTGVGVTTGHGIALSSSASISNAGTIHVGNTGPIKTNGIQLFILSTFTNTSTGVFNIDNTLGLFAILPKSGTTFNNQGQLNIGATVQVNNGIGDNAGTGGTVANTGSMTFGNILLDGIYNNQTIANNSAGTIVVPATGKLKIANLGILINAVGSTTNNSGTVTNNGNINNSGSFNNNGIYKGTGFFNSSIFSNPVAGTVAPGLSPGCHQFTNGWSSVGKLEVEINGPNVCSDFDQLQVTGNAQAGGDLNVSFGFTPVCAQTFQIVNANTYSGSFSNIFVSPNNLTATYNNGILKVWDTQTAVRNVQDNLYYCTLIDAVLDPQTGDNETLEIPAGTYIDACINVNKSITLKSVGGPVIVNCIVMNGAGKTMILDGNFTFNNLTLTDGKIRTNGNNLKCGTISGGSAASYVITD